MCSHDQKVSDFVSEIVNEISISNYCYLINCTGNMMTSALHELSDAASEYHTSSIDIFRKFSDRFRDVFGPAGVILIYPCEGTHCFKIFSHYNLDLDVKYLFDLIIYQEFGVEPVDEWHKKKLQDSLKAEKIKNSLVYSCYLNDDEKILARLESTSQAQLNKAFDAFTPLGFCVRHDNLEMFKALLAAGAKLDKKTVMGKAPLEYAFETSPQIVKYIYENHRKHFDEEVAKKGFSIAYHCKEPELLQLILASGSDIDCPGKPHPPLHSFADYNNLSGLTFLLDNGADPLTLNKQKQTVLDRTINVKVIELIKNHSA